MIHPERRRENLKKIEEIDREKVVKGLEECTGNGNCTKCQYVKEKQTLSCKKLLADALELIKSSRLIHTEHALYTVYERHDEEQNV